ncbi:MAG: hypothetical protein JW772_03480 [Candidatus Diapherotrites archaeon]|nr:hypothetical protein [Candidatus Diapherotrites archaeon]
MNEKSFLEAMQKMRDSSKQRKFTQSIELMINFRGLDVKKSENQVNVKLQMPFATGKGSGKVLVFAKDKTFIEQIKGKVERVISESEIQGLGKKDVVDIADSFDVLLAEGPVMLTVGKFLGQQLAPKGKMPKPIQPDPNQIDFYVKEASTVTRVGNKKKGKPMPVVQAVIGNEKMSNEELAANANAVLKSVVDSLPGKNQNLKSVYIKETMGPSIKVGENQ